MWKLFVVGLFVAPLWAGAVLAQSPAPTKVRTAESIECSKQADAKGLHGKARKKYRAACKMQHMKKAKM